MTQPVRLITLVATATATLFLSGCFSSNPSRPSEGDSQGQGSTSSGSSRPATSSPSSSPSQSGSQGQSSTTGRTSPGSTASAPQSSSTPTRETRQGSTSASQPQAGGTTRGDPGGASGAADVRVATADSSAAGTNAPDAPQSDVGGAAGTRSDEPDVGVAEALEGANAAVDAATEAVGEAEAAIDRAREAADSAAGSSDEDSFDPWARPGGGSESNDAATATAGGGGGQPARAAADASESGRPGGGSDATAGEQAPTASAGGRSAGEDNFDPFADYAEPGGAGAPGQPTGMPASGSLQIADDAVAAARAALERARRALITAADAGRPGSGDADAEAVQLAAARAAMEAAAEAVIASAIAVMAASQAYAPDADYGGEPEDAASDEDLLADNVARVVAIVQRDMRNAADALDATGELLAAAGDLMAVLGRNEDARMADEEDGTQDDPGDRVASLEEQLDRSLAVFDDRMNAEGSTIVRGMGGEDSEITAAAAAGASDTSSSQRRTGTPRNESGAMDGSIERPDVAWNEPRNSQARDPEIPADYDQDYDIEDAATPQDDDIIARQLREAALAEQDPELREALWQEYVAYKDSLEAETN